MAEGANLHKPATVSGGGKSEISKRLEDMIKYFLVRSCRVLRVCVLPCVVCVRAGATSRKRGGRCCSNVMTQLLERRYGPVYVNDITKDFDMVEGIFAKDFAGIALHRHFCTDAVNGALGHELKYNGKPVLSSVIRVGFR